MSVREAQERISAREFSEWIAFHAVSPIGDDRRDLRMGILAATSVNIWTGKGDEPVSPQDFIPDFIQDRDQKPEVQVEDEEDPEEVRRRDMEFVNALGAIRKTEK